MASFSPTFGPPEGWRSALVVVAAGAAQRAIRAVGDRDAIAVRGPGRGAAFPALRKRRPVGGGLGGRNEVDSRGLVQLAEQIVREAEVIGRVEARGSNRGRVSQVGGREWKRRDRDVTMTTKTQQPDVVRPNRQPACERHRSPMELRRNVTSPGRRGSGRRCGSAARAGGGLRDRTVAVGTSRRPAGQERRRELRRGEG